MFAEEHWRLAHWSYDAATGHSSPPACPPPLSLAQRTLRQTRSAATRKPGPGRATRLTPTAPRLTRPPTSAAPPAAPPPATPATPAPSTSASPRQRRQHHHPFLIPRRQRRRHLHCRRGPQHLPARKPLPGTGRGGAGGPSAAASDPARSRAAGGRRGFGAPAGLAAGSHERAPARGAGHYRQDHGEGEDVHQPGGLGDAGGAVAVRAREHPAAPVVPSPHGRPLVWGVACPFSRTARDASRVFAAQRTYDGPTMPSTPPKSIEPSDDKAVIEPISPDRLNPYPTACAGYSAAALALYWWNRTSPRQRGEHIGSKRRQLTRSRSTSPSLTPGRCPRPGEIPQGDEARVRVSPSPARWCRHRPDHSTRLPATYPPRLTPADLRPVALRASTH